jgi:dihydropteroate synthase
VRLRLSDTRLPLVMGILNTTPDSVSDQERYLDLDSQLARAEQLLDEGADLIEVGGESGRTDVPAASAEEEIERVVPLVRELARRGVTVAVDTFKPEVARAALDAGAAMINDVSGLRDPAIADACAHAGAALVIMHTRAEPKEESFPGYRDPVADVVEFLRERIDLAAARGVEEILIDPGPDFAKTPEETVEVLRRLDELSQLGRPLLLAVSRKYFVGVITGRRPADRLGGTLAAVAHGLDHGAAILRVHDVAEVVAFLEVRRVLRDEAEVPQGAHEDDRLKWEPH